MDWWPASKCDYGVCPWKNASVLTADLNDPLLVGAGVPAVAVRVTIDGKAVLNVAANVSRPDLVRSGAAPGSTRIGLPLKARLYLF